MGFAAKFVETLDLDIEPKANGFWATMGRLQDPYGRHINNLKTRVLPGVDLVDLAGPRQSALDKWGARCVSGIRKYHTSPPNILKRTGTGPLGSSPGDQRGAGLVELGGAAAGALTH